MQKFRNKIAHIVYKGNNFTYIISDISFRCDYIKSDGFVYFSSGQILQIRHIIMYKYNNVTYIMYKSSDYPNGKREKIRIKKL